MDDVIEQAVERVILAMQENLGEQITIDDMAHTAMFSKFHFSRIFQRVTGISPGRFLSALRLQEAKRLLVSTSMTVADISHVVGYNSIGTFSSRFRCSVGVSPTEYRQCRGDLTPLDARQPAADGRPAIVHGTVHQPMGGRPGSVVVGLFPARIAQGRPIRHTTLDGVGPFTIPDVPEGSWHIMVHSVDDGGGIAELVVQEPHVATFGPIDVRSGVPVRAVDLWLRARRIFDPPVLFAQFDQPARARQARASDRADHLALPGA